MATTIMISTSVKPALRMFLVCFILRLLSSRGGTERLAGYDIMTSRSLNCLPQPRRKPLSKVGANSKIASPKTKRVIYPLSSNRNTPTNLGSFHGFFNNDSQCLPVIALLLSLTQGYRASKVYNVFRDQRHGTGQSGQ